MNVRLGVFLFCIAGARCIWCQTNVGQTNVGFGSGTANSAAANLAAGSGSTLMITGSVRMGDGSPLPGTIAIQMVCNGVPRTLTHTTVMEDFGFQMSDARETGSPRSQSTFNPLSNANADAGSAGSWTGRSQGGSCELRADLPGYDSSVINLRSTSAFEGTSVGILWLHRIQGKRVGNVINISTLKAPKEALKKFDKGIELFHTGKLQEAVGSFGEAVRIDPEFAEAWLNLGRSQYRMRSTEAAKTSAQRALDLDPKMAGAWQILGYIASDQEDWDTVVRNLDNAERLDPEGSGLPWFVSAVAYYRLHRYADAERSIQREMKLNPRDQYSRSQYLLGLILIARHDVEGGYAALRNYLAGSPDPRDVVTAKALLNAPTTLALK